MKKTILCIDDIETNLFTLRSVIDSLASEDYTVITALSAHEGLEILIKQKVDLILLDVMMPEIDGFAAAKIIKSNKKTKNIPIIFVTAKKDDETIDKCYKVGGNDYVTKPFNHVELLSRISFHLKLITKSELLNEEKEYIQSVLDLQENMIIVTDGMMSKSVNNALLNFYELEDIYEFQRSHGCICFTFLKEDGYFSLELVDEGTDWVDEVIRLSAKEDVLVKILKDGIEHIFNVKARTFRKQFIVTLTDITQVSQLSLEYKHEASYDSLTQIYNRNMFHRLIDKKIINARKMEKSFVFILLDIDYFKKVNDIHGHLVGDDILKSITKLIKGLIRETDLFARWGGEEFVLAFDADLEKGLEIAESLRKHIDKEEFDVVKTITCSFGLCEFKLDDNLDTLIKRADIALYKAKDNGRNRVCQA